MPFYIFVYLCIHNINYINLTISLSDLIPIHLPSFLPITSHSIAQSVVRLATILSPPDDKSCTSDSLQWLDDYSIKIGLPGCIFRSAVYDRC